MLYTARRVKKLVQRLKEEYDGVLKQQREEAERLKEENRNLSARVHELEGERASVAQALILASQEGERLKAAGQKEEANERNELRLLAQKCRLLAEDLRRRHPNEEDVAEFASYTDDLGHAMGEEAETGFRMEEVIAPGKPLDLGKLCRELGLMEEDT